MSQMWLSICGSGSEPRLKRQKQDHSLLSGWKPIYAGRCPERAVRAFFLLRSGTLVGNRWISWRQISTKRLQSSQYSPNGQQRTGNCARYAAVVLLALGITTLSGCSSSLLDRMWHKPSQHVEHSPETVRQTHLQGQLASWEAIPFHSKPFSSLTQHSFCEEGGDFDPDVSSDGKWLVFTSLRHSPNPDIYIKQTHGATATRLTSDPASEMQPAFSPTGDKVAYATNRTGNWDIWVIGVDGTNPTRLTSGISNDIHPSWSPDGKLLVYCSFGQRSHQWELWTVDVGNPTTKNFIGYGLFPEWSPNPKVPKIAYQLARHRGSKWFSVWTVDFVEGEAKYPTEIVSNINYACICPAWSPDADKLTYSTVNKVNYEPAAEPVPAGSTGEDVWMVDIDGRNNLRLTQGDAANFSPQWSPDGRVFFCSDRQGIQNVWSVRPKRVDFAAEKPVDLTRHPQGGIMAN